MLCSYLANLSPRHSSHFRRTRPGAHVSFEFAVSLEHKNGPVLRLPTAQYGIVLSVHNEAKSLRHTLRPLLQLTTGFWDLVMMLDDTNDNSAEVIAAELASYATRPVGLRFSTRRLISARVLRAGAPGLFEVAALNVGFQLLAPTEYYVALQADMLLGEVGWNHFLSLPLRQYRDLFVISGRCAHGYPTGSVAVDAAGMCSRRFFWRLSKQELSTARASGVFVRDSANIGPFLVRADAMQALGFFDEAHYHLGGGFEHDLCVRGFALLGLRSGYFAIDVYTEQDWRVTPRSGALSRKRVVADKEMLGIIPSGSFEHTREALSLPRRSEVRAVSVGLCQKSVDACVLSRGEKPVPASRVLNLVAFTTCEESRPFNESCMLHYYVDELKMLMRAAADEKVQIWRSENGFAVTPVFAEAAMSTFPSNIDATILMHEVTSWSTQLESYIKKARKLYPLAPVVVLLTKVWKVTQGS